MRDSCIAAAVVIATVASTAVAQVQSEHPPTSAPSTRNDCSAASGAPRSDETTGSKSLSERLSESKGVICPPAGIDPGLTVPPISGGRTPVIPPPGTPGGDPGIQPK